MAQVMAGVRVLELAQYVFVPAAGAVLADWGADVIKIEHPVRGDTMRGFLRLAGMQIPPQRNTTIEHPNRGKRSVGVDVSTPQGQQLIYRIAKTADVFLTSFLPEQRQKLKLDVEHIRARTSSMHAAARMAIRARKGRWADTTARLSGRGAASAIR